MYAIRSYYDQLVGTLLVDGLGAGLAAIGAPAWLSLLVANGLGGGVV